MVAEMGQGQPAQSNSPEDRDAWGLDANGCAPSRHPQISLAVYESDVPLPTGNAPPSVHVDMPNPTPEQLESPAFQAIWKVIKTWDINVPECYYGYCGAHGSHVAMILNALREVPQGYLGGQEGKA